jgi:hypothetical protein
MMKPPEDGLIWEWRAFGRVSPELERWLHSHPIRMGIKGQEGFDEYFISTESEQNVKIRRYRTGSVLKFKFLLAVGEDGIELYAESPDYTYRFPLNIEHLRKSARLLGVESPGVELEKIELSTEEFAEQLLRPAPAVSMVGVGKRRWQFICDGGWLELADIAIKGHTLRTISIHSPELAVVQDIKTRIDLSKGLEVMNYVRACRRWGEGVKG